MDVSILDWAEVAKSLHSAIDTPHLEAFTTNDINYYFKISLYKSRSGSVATRRTRQPGQHFKLIVASKLHQSSNSALKNNLSFRWAQSFSRVLCCLLAFSNPTQTKVCCLHKLKFHCDDYGFGCDAMQDATCNRIVHRLFNCLMRILMKTSGDRYRLTKYHKAKQEVAKQRPSKVAKQKVANCFKTLAIPRAI